MTGDATALGQALRREVKGELLTKEPLRNHTSFRVGGVADLLFCPVDEEDVKKALEFASREGIPVFVLGNGTNVLVRDGGIRGLTLHLGALTGIMGGEAAAAPREGDLVRLEVLAGTLLSRLINHSVKAGLSGLEFAAGIPGTVGGAAVMNAGAHGSSFGDIVDSVSLVDERGESHIFPAEEVEFRYRGSRLPREGVITRVGVKLTWRGEARVLEEVKYCLSERNKRLPFGFGMAGSIFKNPPGDFAGRLIEKAGLKGDRIGRAEVSHKHANVIVNLGGAKAEEILSLVDRVRERVREESGIELMTEIIVAGEE